MTDTPDLVAIDHVQLAMPLGGEDSARRFYAGLLGLVEVDKPPLLAQRGGAWFVGAGEGVHLHLGVEPDFRAARKAHPCFVVADLDGLRRRLGAAGIEVRDDHAISDVVRFYASDPFGNRLEFVAARDAGFTARSAKARR